MSQYGMLPYQLGAQQEYGKKFADNQYDYSQGKASGTADTQAEIMSRLQGGADNAQNQQRASDARNYGNFAGQFRQGMDAANPEMAAAGQAYLSSLSSGAPQVGGLPGVRNVNAGQVGQVNDPLLQGLNMQAATAGRTPLQMQQEGIAASELSKGGSLGSQEVNDIVQQIRGRGEERGLVDSNRTFAGEVLGVDSAQRQRLAERMAQAQSVDASGFGQTQGNRDFALGTVGQNRGITGQNLQAGQFNVATDFAGQQANQGADQFRSSLDFQRQATNAGLQQQQTGMLGDAMGRFSSAYTDPIMNQYNRQTVAPGLSANTMGQNWGMTQQGQVTDPWDPYGQDIGNTNANARNNANINQQNQSAAQRAGWMTMISQLIPQLGQLFPNYGQAPAPTTPGTAPPPQNAGTDSDPIGNILPGLIGSIIGGGGGNFSNGGNDGVAPQNPTGGGGFQDWAGQQIQPPWTPPESPVGPYDPQGNWTGYLGDEGQYPSPTTPSKDTYPKYGGYDPTRALKWNPSPPPGHWEEVGYGG